MSNIKKIDSKEQIIHNRSQELSQERTEKRRENLAERRARLLHEKQLKEMTDKYFNGLIDDIKIKYYVSALLKEVFNGQIMLEDDDPQSVLPTAEYLDIFKNHQYNISDLLSEENLKKLNEDVYEGEEKNVLAFILYFNQEFYHIDPLAEFRGENEEYRKQMRADLLFCMQTLHMTGYSLGFDRTILDLDTRESPLNAKINKKSDIQRNRMKIRKARKIKDRRIVTLTGKKKAFELIKKKKSERINKIKALKNKTEEKKKDNSVIEISDSEQTEEQPGNPDELGNRVVPVSVVNDPQPGQSIDTAIEVSEDSSEDEVKGLPPPPTAKDEEIKQKKDDSFHDSEALEIAKEMDKKEEEKAVKKIIIKDKEEKKPVKEPVKKQSKVIEKKEVKKNKKDKSSISTSEVLEIIREEEKKEANKPLTTLAQITEATKELAERIDNNSSTSTSQTTSMIDTIEGPQIKDENKEERRANKRKINTTQFTKPRLDKDYEITLRPDKKNHKKSNIERVPLLSKEQSKNKNYRNFRTAYRVDNTIAYPSFKQWLEKIHPLWYVYMYYTQTLPSLYYLRRRYLCLSKNIPFEQDIVFEEPYPAIQEYIYEHGDNNPSVEGTPLSNTRQRLYGHIEFHPNRPYWIKEEEIPFIECFDDFFVYYYDEAYRSNVAQFPNKPMNDFVNSIIDTNILDIFVHRLAFDHVLYKKYQEQKKEKDAYKEINPLNGLNEWEKETIEKLETGYNQYQNEHPEYLEQNDFKWEEARQMHLLMEEVEKYEDRLALVDPDELTQLFKQQQEEKKRRPNQQ